MTRLIARRLSVQHYRITSLKYQSGGGRCENCGRAITWLATVVGEETRGCHVIGMDCAATYAEATDYQMWKAKVEAVKKCHRYIKYYTDKVETHKRQRAYWSQRDAEDGGDRMARHDYAAMPPIKLLIIHASGELVVKIPKDAQAELAGRMDYHAYESFRVPPADWESHWGGIEQKLRDLGVDVTAPEPATAAVEA